MDQIFTLKQILEKTLEYGVETYHLFIVQAAYDKVSRDRLYQAMHELHIPPKLIRMVRAIPSSSKCQIRIQSHLSRSVDTMNGLKQGDALACLLFSTALEKVIQDSGIQTGRHIFNRVVQLLAYAYDIDIISRNENNLKNAFRALESSAKNMGLAIYENKTNFMAVGTNNYNISNILTEGYNFESVKGFVYLGTYVAAENNCAKEIERRINYGC